MTRASINFLQYTLLVAARSRLIHISAQCAEPLRKLLCAFFIQVQRIAKFIRVGKPQLASTTVTLCFVSNSRKCC